METSQKHLKHAFTDRSFRADYARHTEKAPVTEFGFSNVEASFLQPYYNKFTATFLAITQLV